MAGIATPAGAAAGAAGAAAIVEAIRASGVIVRVGPEEFRAILARSDAPLVVTATGGFFTRNYQYLTSYKGLAFFSKSPDPLELPAAVEIVAARKIWIPA